MFDWMRKRRENEALRRAKHQAAHDRLEAGLDVLRAALQEQQQRLASDLEALQKKQQDLGAGLDLLRMQVNGFDEQFKMLSSTVLGFHQRLQSEHAEDRRKQEELENNRYSAQDPAFQAAVSSILAAAEATAARHAVAADNHSAQNILNSFQEYFHRHKLDGPVQQGLKEAAANIVVLQKSIVELKNELAPLMQPTQPSAPIVQPFAADDAIAELMARAKAMQQSLANMERELWSQPSRPADPWEADIPVPPGPSNVTAARRSGFTPAPPANINDGTYAIVDPRTEAIIGYGQE